MSEYKYELHAHTSEVSKCSFIEAKELVRLYKRLGYTGIFITDHLTGNCKFAHDLPWNEWVRSFCSGYQNARKAGFEEGIDVFFGWEYTAVPGIDFLTLGLDEKWLEEHEGLTELHFSEYFKLVRESGGFIAQAHPFREAFYIPMIGLAPADIEAVEVFNANRRTIENERAEWYANSYSLLKVCGSDTHSAEQKIFAYMSSDKKAEDPQEIVRLIRSGNMNMGKINV